MFEEEHIDYLLKIILVGDSNVGKTNILSRYIKNYFSEDTKNTLGVDFQTKDIVKENKKIKTQFWDTAGQEKYKAIASAYYKNAHGALIVYDVTKRESFENAKKWYLEMKEKSDLDTEIILIGNKIDLDFDRNVPYENGLKFSKENDIFFFEVSAKENKNNCVSEAFDILIDHILENYKIMEKKKESFNEVKIRNNIENDKEISKSFCCRN
jgi:small GTP-binding protein